MAASLAYIEPVPGRLDPLVPMLLENELGQLASGRAGEGVRSGSSTDRPSHVEEGGRP